MMYFSLACFVFYGSLTLGRCSIQLGEVHTSIAQISELVSVENEIVSLLKKHLKTEEERLNHIKRYVEDWTEVEPYKITNDPLSSYHFLQRLSTDFKNVENSLSECNSVGVVEKINKMRSNQILPTEADVNGAALALVRLQDIYHLALEDLVRGVVNGVHALKGLTVSDCLRFGDQSFKNLQFDLSEKWTLKGVEILESRGNFTFAEKKRLANIRNILQNRKEMQGLVIKIAQKSGKDVTNRFSGLGIPASFHKKIHKEPDANTQLSTIEDNYRKLCRGDVEEHPYEGLSCEYFRGHRPFLNVLMPFKLELVWPDPIVLIYHDVLTDAETKKLRDLALPKLVTTRVHSFTSYSPTESYARVGKTAWMTRSDTPLVDKILKRIRQMTGFSINSAEDLHILNYGIGGHYDLHIDFFDLHDKNMDPNPHLGDRFATVLFYLNDVKAGGATVFPSLGLRIPARKGSAAVWLNLKRNGRGDYRTLHASCPVLLGQKWIANLWLHEFGQEFLLPCAQNQEE